MTDNPMNLEIADLTEEPDESAILQAWLAAHPERKEELFIARRVRRLMIALGETEVILPPDFEARLMERVREDATVLDLFDLSLFGFGSVLLELLEMLFAFFPSPAASTEMPQTA